VGLQSRDDHTCLTLVFPTAVAVGGFARLGALKEKHLSASLPRVDLRRKRGGVRELQRNVTLPLRLEGGDVDNDAAVLGDHTGISQDEVAVHGRRETEDVVKTLAFDDGFDHFDRFCSKLSGRGFGPDGGTLFIDPGDHERVARLKLVGSNSFRHRDEMLVIRRASERRPMSVGLKPDVREDLDHLLPPNEPWVLVVGHHDFPGFVHAIDRVSDAALPRIYQLEEGSADVVGTQNLRVSGEAPGIRALTKTDGQHVSGDLELFHRSRQSKAVRWNDTDIADHIHKTLLIEILGIHHSRVDVGEDLEFVGHSNIVAIAGGSVTDQPFSIGCVSDLTGFERFDHAVVFSQMSNLSIAENAHLVPSVDVGFGQQDDLPVGIARDVVADFGAIFFQELFRDDFDLSASQKRGCGWDG